MRIDIEHLSYITEGVSRLGDVTCSFSPGITYVVGKNGAGKSTLLKLLTTVLPLQTGKITVSKLTHDRQIGTYRKQLSKEELRKIIGFLPQHFTGYPQMTVHRYVIYTALHKGIPRQLVKGIVQMWLEETNLLSKKKEKLQRLSDGELQKIGLIQALLAYPRICILDEPFTGLDIGERLFMEQKIRRLAEHSIVIVSTHLLDELSFTGRERVLHLSNGKVISEGGAETFKKIRNIIELID